MASRVCLQSFLVGWMSGHVCLQPFLVGWISSHVCFWPFPVGWMVSLVCLRPFPVGFSIFSSHQLSFRVVSWSLISSGSASNPCAGSAAHRCWAVTVELGWLFTLVLPSSDGCILEFFSLACMTLFFSDQASCYFSRLVAYLSLAKLSPLDLVTSFWIHCGFSAVLWIICTVR